MQQIGWAALTDLLGHPSNPPSGATQLLSRAEPARFSRRGSNASNQELGTLAMGIGFAGFALRMRRKRD